MGLGAWILACAGAEALGFLGSPSWTPAPLPPRSETVADRVEFVADLVREAFHGHDGGQRDQSSDERILDQVLPGFVGPEALQPLRQTAQSRYSRQAIFSRIDPSLNALSVVVALLPGAPGRKPLFLGGGVSPRKCEF